MSLLHKMGILCFLLLFVSCEEDESLESNMSFELSADYNNETLILGEKYTNAADQGFFFSLFKLYLSRISLVSDTGELHELSEVILHDFENAEAYEWSVPAGNYTALQFDLGLDEALNGSDENSFPVEHPLSYAQNTHWGWASLYKFVMMEGRSADDASLDVYPTAFAYHTGTDTTLRSVFLPIDLSVSETEASELKLQLNLEQVFDGTSSVDIVEENFTHSGGDQLPLAIKLSDLIAEAFEIN